MRACAGSHRHSTDIQLASRGGSGRIEAVCASNRVWYMVIRHRWHMRRAAGTGRRWDRAIPVPMEPHPPRPKSGLRTTIFFANHFQTPLPGPPLQSFNHCGKKTAVTKVALLCKNQSEMKHFSNLKPSTLHFWGGFSTNPVWHLARWVGEETV